MAASVRWIVLAVSLLATAPVDSLAAPDTEPPTVPSRPPMLGVEKAEGRLLVKLDDEVLATYVTADEQIKRPYFANVHTTSGELVTRHHPPREGMELTDHATMHPGVWLAFGDLSGADFWRNKGVVEHVEFVTEPKVTDGVLEFVVRNRYVSGEKVVCTEVCRHTIRPTEHGWLLTYDSGFTGEKAFAFGDQEEMGLGVRVAAPLRVRAGGGTIVNAEGHQNEKGVWGKPSDYVAYGGVVGERRVGLLVVPHPENFRKSWFHARDYGFVAANPFGRKAFMAGEPSRVEVKPGETFRLRFGVLVYSTPEPTPFDAKVAAKSYVDAVMKGMASTGDDPKTPAGTDDPAATGGTETANTPAASAM